MLLPQMLSDLISTTVSIALALATSGNRTEVCTLIVEVNAVLVADAVRNASEALGARRVRASCRSEGTITGTGWRHVVTGRSKGSKTGSTRDACRVLTLRTWERIDVRLSIGY
jgi:hypothetical protein